MARQKKIKGILGTAARIGGKIAGFTPAGRVAKTALGVAKGARKVLGFRAVSRRSRGITQKYINRAATRLIKARIEGKILKERMKVINVIK